MKWIVYQFKAFLYYLMFKKKYPAQIAGSFALIEDKAEPVLIMPDEIRRQELHDKYKEQWSHPGEMDVAFRIKEKEDDAERINGKLLGHLDSLLVNASLLALTNEQLAELLKQSAAFTLELDLEAKRRA